MNIDLIAKGAQLELARRDFFFYCHLTASDFYKEDRSYLKELCGELQDFYYSDDDVMVVNMPPRHGKSRTAGKFAEWVFGQNKEEKIMTGSYNETLSTVFSKNVRNAIQEEKADESRIVYSDIFPDVRIKQGDAAMNLWSLEGGYNNYLATSPTGTATGFGATLIIIDDLIKNAEEAYNDNVLEKHWNWFTNTMLSRLEEGGKIIIIMTRWATDDLAGRALRHFEQEKKKVRHINMKALQDDGSMLCDEILSKESFQTRIGAMGKDIVAANYQQEPIDIQGRLYSKLKTYTDIPKDNNGNPLFERTGAYIDTADEGDDYLCAIVYGEYNKEAYILDVIYTKEPMEVTEPATAKMLYENDVNIATIESNNGGRGFSRQVERILREKYNSNKTTILWFHQSKNKKARILSNATWVMSHIYFPVNWKDKWPEYYNAMMTYQREGKNKHDDACLVAGTKVATLSGDKPIEDIKEGERVITPFGVRKVLWAGCTGRKEVVTNAGLTGTRDHKVFTKNMGFTTLDALTCTAENDIISLRGLVQWKYKKLLCSTEWSTGLWGRESIILVNQVRIKGGSVLKDFMWRFGNIIMERKCLKAIMFTTKMVTLLTTTLATWSAYQIGNTFQHIARKTSKMKSLGRKIKGNLTRLGRRLVNGTGAKRGEDGTRSTLKELLKTSSRLRSSAKSATKSFRASDPMLGFARTDVENDGGESTEGLSTLQPAQYVEKNSRPQNINRHLPKEKRAQKHVQTNSITEIEKRKVYNLTVEKDHVYYADGLLVSNCDATTGIAETINMNIAYSRRNYSGKGARR